MYAQDSTAFFYLTQEDIQANNITNLEEALNSPGLYQFSSNNISTTVSGVLTLQDIAVYKDGLPLLMDQNTDYDLRAIPMYDITRMEVIFGPNSTVVKSSASVLINLYTKDFEEKPIGLSAGIINTSATDFHSTIQLALSNRVHEGQIGVNRSYTAPLFDKVEDRGTVLGATERYDLNLRYRYHILKSVQLEVGGEHSSFKTEQRSNVIEGTTRVRDVEQNLKRNRVYAMLTTALSKNHTLYMKGLLHTYVNEKLTIDKDLSSGIKQTFAGGDAPYTSGYDQGYFQLLLRSQTKSLSYDVGFELNTIRDNVFSSIDAISTEYSDYSVLGQFEYSLKKSLKLQAGAKLLTHSLSQSYFLPNVRLTLAPKNTLQFEGSFQSSLSYPLFSELFYPEAITHQVDNNLRLLPRKLNSLNLNVTIKKEKLKMHSGVLVSSVNNTAVVQRNGKLRSIGQSRGVATFGSLEFNTKYLNIRPNFVLHAISPARDTNDFSFFYPEANINLHIGVPKTRLRISAVGRAIGKRTSAAHAYGTLYYEEYQKMSTLSLSAMYPFMDDRLKLRFGVKNIGQQKFIDSQIYLLSGLDRIDRARSTLIVNRDRTFFFSMVFDVL